MTDTKEVKNYLKKKNINSPDFKTIELSTFYIGEYLFGIDIINIQEINPYLTVTPVPHAPFHIKGVTNLRGQIVTVLDMRKVLGLEKIDITEEHRNIIINDSDEWLGLLVDRISDVIPIKPEHIEPPPRLRGVDTRFIKGVYKLEKKLLLILDLKEVMKV